MEEFHDRSHQRLVTVVAPHVALATLLIDGSPPIGFSLTEDAGTAAFPFADDLDLAVLGGSRDGLASRAHHGE